MMCAAEQGSAEGSVEGSALAALLHEARRFDPPPDFAAQANAGPGVYREAGRDHLAWWAEQAGNLDWGAPWTSILDWEEPYARWFVGGRLNASRQLRGPSRGGRARGTGRLSLGGRARG